MSIQNHGFSLIEMLVVVAILAMLAQMSFVLVRPSQHQTLQQMTLELPDQILALKRQALWLAEPRGLHVSPEGVFAMHWSQVDGGWLKSEISALSHLHDRFTVSSDKLPGSPLTSRHSLFESAFDEPGDFDVVFYSDGTSTGGSVRLATEAGQSAYLTINSMGEVLQE
ncbi:MAG: prepilin-type N-terminal cleavage/methylation domain-containing protein [Verrucomicrobiota bacterium]